MKHLILILIILLLATTVTIAQDAIATEAVTPVSTVIPIPDGAPDASDTEIAVVWAIIATILAGFFAVGWMLERMGQAANALKWLEYGMNAIERQTLYDNAVRFQEFTERTTNKLDDIAGDIAVAIASGIVTTTPLPHDTEEQDKPQ